MNLRLLIIGEDEKKRASEVVAYASRASNIYHPGPKAKVPGDLSEHVSQFGEFRTVFSWTKVKNGLFRHLSVSVGNRTTLPNPVMVAELAHLFGFTGSYEQWQIEVDPKAAVVVVAQRISDVAVSMNSSWPPPMNPS